MPLGFESVTHIRMWKPQREWIGRSGGVRAKYMSEVTFGNVGKMSSMFLEAEPEQHHSGDVSHHMNPRRDSEPQALCRKRSDREKKGYCEKAGHVQQEGDTDANMTKMTF